MAITKTNQPYEFLVRWNNGTLAGAHIRFLETLTEDGVVLSQKEGNAQPVSLAGEAGFPIEDILDGLQATALSDLAAAQAAKATAESALTAKQAEMDEALATAQAAHAAELAAVQAGMDAERTALQTALAAKDAEIATLEVQVVALTPAPTTVNAVPQSVTMRQARLALLQSGLLDEATAAVAGAGPAAQIEWEYSSDVGRNVILVQALSSALGLTDEDLDGLFVLAATL